MIVVEHHKIELDYCPFCRGVWFDAQELDLMLSEMELNHDLPLEDILNSPETTTSETKRRCPIGGDKMKKVSLGSSPSVLIDICSKGHGLWFDGGEVIQLLKQLSEGDTSDETPSEKKVFSFLGEVFSAQQ
jgi:Zn-finger nucleic acid-binding protein